MLRVVTDRSFHLALNLKSMRQTLAEKGIRSTRKRQIILDVFYKAGGHLTIEDLLEKVRKQDPKIGYVTVYRMLKLLKESGLAHQWQFGDGYSRFEKVTSHHHDHLICMKCGKIIEFHDEQIEQLQDQIALKYHFQVERHVHEIFGYCAKCH